MTNENTEETAVEEAETSNILEQPLPMDNEAEEKEAETPETEEAEEVAEVEESTEVEEKPKKKISGFHRKRLRDKATIEAQQAEIERLKSKPTAPPQDGAPDPEKYEHGINDINYINAMAQHAGRQAYFEEKKKDQATNQQQRVLQTYRDAQDNYMEKMDEAASTHDDFDEVVNSVSTDRLDQNVQYAIMTSENAGELAYHLGSNPKLYKKLEGMNPVQAIRELGKLEDKLTPKKKTAVSKMPKPVSTLGTSKVTSHKEYDGTQTQEEFEATHSIEDLD